MAEKPTYEELERSLATQNQELRQTIERLRETRDYLENLISYANAPIIVWDRESQITRFNHAFEGLTGYAAHEVIGQKVHMLFPKASRDQSLSMIASTLSGEYWESVEIPILRKNGDIRIVLWNSANIYAEDNTTLIATIAQGQDITKHKQADKTLRQSEERYRRITEAVTDYVFEVRVEDGHPVETVHRPACVAVTGYTPEDFASDPYLWFKMVHEEDHEAVREQASQVLSGLDVKPLEHRIFRKDAVMRWVKNTLVPNYDPHGKILSYDGLISDITERKQAEEEKRKLEAQLQQAHKMEAIGTLAGGIAHDFNNILAAIAGYTELVQLDVPGGSQSSANLAEVLKATNRAKELVKHILTFSRQSKSEQKPLQISPIVKEALELLRASIPTTIEIRQDIKKESGAVMADPTQIHRVMMNLCTNAAHAIQEKGGTLEVSLEDIELDADASTQYFDLKPGPYVRLTVSDTGYGMDHTVRKRIFDPFFTTKEPSRGTGMGLAVVHGIVKDHGGAIIVDSEPAKGSTFQVFFPRIESEALLEAESGLGGIPTGNERILFVDDEEAMVNMGKQMLKSLGYEVVARTSSIEALEAFRAQPDSFDLVITDMTMPNMTGDLLAKELMGIRDDIPIVLCTGHIQMISEEKANAMGIRGFAMKPMVMRDVAGTIRRVFDQQKET